jgi:creatinine amidohydrolase
VIALAGLTSPRAARLARDPRAVMLLPLGAIEQHGPHLPLVVDLLGAEELARRIAPHLRRAGFRPVLAPAIPYGVSTLAVGWPGTVSLSAGTLRRLIVEVVRQLAGHGFRRVVLTNYQADPDHLRAIAAALRALGRRRGLRVLVAGFAPGGRRPTPMVNPRVRALLRSPNAGAEWHAGELETAMVLAVDRRLVRQGLTRRLPPCWVDVDGALARGARNFRQIAPGGRGYFGWPRAARATTGRKAMALRGRLIARELVRALGKPRRP